MRIVLALAMVACGDNHQMQLDAPPAVDAPPDAPPTFSAPITISDPANMSFVPAIAWRAGKVVVAWHDFPAGGGMSRVVTTTIVNGVPGPITPIADTAVGPKRPTLAATTSGFVLAYD